MPDKVREITIDISRRGDPQEIILGRPGTPGVDYGIEGDAYVSNRHAKISLTALGTVYVEDIGSTNGTRVDGRSTKFSKVLINPPGAVVTVGRTNIKISLVDDWLSKVTSDSMTT